MRPVLIFESVDLTLLSMDGKVNNSMFMELDSFFIDDVMDLLVGVQDEERLLDAFALRVVYNVLAVCFKRDNRASRQLIDLFLCDRAGFGAMLLKFPHLFSVASGLGIVYLLAISADDMSFDHVLSPTLFDPGLLLVQIGGADDVVELHDESELGQRAILLSQ